MKICLNLLKLHIKYRRLFFPDTVYFVFMFTRVCVCPCVHPFIRDVVSVISVVGTDGFSPNFCR